MRISLLPLFFFITTLLIGCKNEEFVLSKLSSVDFKTETTAISFKVVYDSDRIVQFGNSIYTYDKSGKVVKEVYKVASTNPEHISGSSIGEIIFEYTWDNQGRLISSEIISNTGVNPGSIYFLYPFARYFYVANSSTMNKIEYYSQGKEMMKSIHFYENKNHLDSIVTTNYRAPNPWFPSGANLTTSTSQTNIQTKSPNAFSTLFASLGFIPRDLSISYQNDVLLPYTILSIESRYSKFTYDFYKGINDRLETIKSFFNIKIDSLAVREQHAQYTFNY